MCCFLMLFHSKPWGFPGMDFSDTENGLDCEFRPRNHVITIFVSDPYPDVVLLCLVPTTGTQ